ncbi:MAG: hypothetical protein WBO06_12290, partial [Gammaproteobacteria bacterium]
GCPMPILAARCWTVQCDENAPVMNKDNMNGITSTSNRAASRWLGLLIAMLCVIFASYSRIQHYDRWQQETDFSDARGMPVMSTLDAYYALRWAADFQSGIFAPHAHDPLRVYEVRRYHEEVPSWLRWRHHQEWLPQLQPKTLPLLSRLLAFGSRFCSNDIKCAGIYLPPVLSSLFIIPLFLYFWRMGDHM